MNKRQRKKQKKLLFIKIDFGNCTKCGQERKIYWAYYFAGKCKECIDAELLGKKEAYEPNPFISIGEK